MTERLERARTRYVAARAVWWASIGMVIVLIVLLAVQSNLQTRCLQGELASRNKPSQDDATAQLTYLKADYTYKQADALATADLKNLLLLPKGSPSAATDYDQFLTDYIADSTAKATDLLALHNYQVTLATDNTYRTAHPLGNCTWPL